MKKTLSVFFFFICFTSISQNLEEQIYTATEHFIANKTPLAFEKLNHQEAFFKNNISTKEEQLAFVFLLCNKGFYLKETNKQHEAITAYEEAWRRYTHFNIQTISDYDIIEYCLKPLGNLYTKTNDYTNAENTIKQYIAIAKAKNNQTQQVAGMINLSALYQSLGKHASVLSLTKQAQQIATIQAKQKEKLERLEASSTIALNKGLVANDIILPNTNTLYNQHQIAYELALKNKDYKSALKHFKATKAFTKRDTLSRRQLAKRHLEEAQLHYVLHDFDTANNNLQAALQLLLPNHKKNSIPEPSSLYTENTFIDIFDFLARLQPNAEKALAYYDLSFHVSHLLTKNITSQEGKIANQVSNRIRSEHCIELLFKLYKNTASTDIFYRALQYAEKNKAAILKDNYSKQSLLEQFPKDSLLLKEQQLLIQQEQLTSTLIKKQLGYETVKNDSLNKQLLDISIALKTVKKKIERKFPNVQNTVNIHKVQEQLKTDNATLVAYFYGNQAIYPFIISANHIDFIKIKLEETTKKSLTDFIHLFDNAAAINNNINAFTHQAHTIYNLLHIKETASIKNLIIIPDGLLNFVPFEALLSQQTSTTNFSKMPFLVTAQNVVYNSSIAFYLLPQSQTKETNVLGVFPVFENTNQPLTYSIAEAKAIKNNTDATLLMHAAATKKSFIDSISDYSVLHLSTHATSGDFIHPANIAFYDAPMLLNELYSLNIHPKLVVLSACETGVGKLQKGEGAMSIARGFQYAGAKNILFSLWQINDASTSELMHRFYKTYTPSASASYANRQSKLSYLKDNTISNLKKSPYYWSAFVYYGNLSTAKQDLHIIYYFIGIVTLVFIVFLIRRKRKTHG